MTDDMPGEASWSPVPSPTEVLPYEPAAHLPIPSDTACREEGGLTALQETALTALLTSSSLEAAAKKTHVSSRTLRRWLTEPVFRRAYLSVRRQALEQATGTLQQAVAGAVAALTRNLRCGHPGVEVRAAQALLAQAARGVEMLEFEERLHAIEQSLGEGSF